MSGPKVSVAICTYNAKRYIDETLQSVFAQTFQNFEIIVIDDGSVDGTADFIEHAYPDPRVTIVRQRNQTLRMARPAAVAHAAGEFIAFLDHDDVWLPHKLERQLDAAAAAPEAALVFSDCLLIDASGRTIGRLSDQHDFGDIDLTGTRGYLELLRRGCFIAYPTAFARAAAVRAVGGFNQTYQYVSDYDLWLRLARRYELKCVVEPLAKYRVHETQFTQCHSDITLAEHSALLRPILATASYPRDVQIAIADTLFGQHRVAFGLLVKQRRFGLAAGAALRIYRYPRGVYAYCRRRLANGPLGPPVRRGLSAFRRGTDTMATSLAHARPAVAPAQVWIDGSPLGCQQTGYFNLLAELVRSLVQHQSPVCTVHIVTGAAGRAALLERLGADASALRFHRIGWRALHWSQIYALLFDWPAQLLLALLSVGLIAVGTARGDVAAVGAAVVLVAAQGAVLVDELSVRRLRETSARPRLAYTARLVRLLWRRLPAPRVQAPPGNIVEVILWRGRFRWRNSRRVAIVQDMTPRLYPEWHTGSNVSEFDEFLGYSQRHAHVVATVSEHSRRDIVNGMAVCPDSVSVVPMPIHPQYRQPHFRRADVLAHGVTDPYVLCVGTMEPRKNLRRLVRAFELLKDEPAVSGHVLVLAGPAGWDAGFREFVIHTDVYPRVRLAGFVPLEHLPSLYHFAAAVICPSLYEGFGLPVLEAMCSSAVVLASRVSALPEVLGEDGILFDPYATADIARALRRAIGMSSTDAETYRRRCRRRADAHEERLAHEGPLPGFAAEFRFAAS